MRIVLKLEELGMLLLGIYGLTLFDVPWWVYTLVLLGPDISMLGYLGGNRIGAISYNTFHHKGIALLVFFLGLYLKNDWIPVTGLILFSHASFDRVMGYGLKYFTGFKSTHLGLIGKTNE